MTDLRTEAALLTDVVLERLSALRGAPAHRTAAEAGVGGVVGGAGVDPACATCGHDGRRADCAGCPVCAVLAVLRGDRPELTVALLDGAITAVTSLRTLLEGTAPASADPIVSPESGSHRSTRISIR